MSSSAIFVSENNVDIVQKRDETTKLKNSAPFTPGRQEIAVGEQLLAASISPQPRNRNSAQK